MSFLTKLLSGITLKSAFIFMMIKWFEMFIKHTLYIYDYETNKGWLKLTASYYLVSYGAYKMTNLIDV